MKLPAETRLILENQLVLLSMLRVMWMGFADRGLLNDNELQRGRVDSQLAKTLNVLTDDLHGAAVEPDRPARPSPPCPNKASCEAGLRDCFCAVGRTMT